MFEATARRGRVCANWPEACCGRMLHGVPPRARTMCHGTQSRMIAMQGRITPGRWITGALVTALVLATALPARAAEEATRFLEGLKSLGY